MDNDLRFLRQQDAINMSRLTSLGITLIGAGAIGSTTAVFLGKMGACGLQVWDADIVEPHNWSNQLYRDEDIGKRKCDALVDVMEAFGGHTPNAIPQRYVDQPLSEVVISAVDSMSSRSASGSPCGKSRKSSCTWMPAWDWKRWSSMPYGHRCGKTA